MVRLGLLLVTVAVVLLLMDWDRVAKRSGRRFVDDASWTSRNHWIIS